MRGTGSSQPVSENEIFAAMPFFDRSSGTPEIYLDSPERNKGRFVFIEVPVCNARLLTSPPSLDREGFAFIRHSSSVTDFYDREVVREEYYREVRDLVKKHTGAKFVVVYEHLIRSTATPPAGIRVRPPAQFMHNDFTPASAKVRARQLCPADEAERLLSGRFLQINVWRPIRGPLKTKPLAVSDATTMESADFVTATQYMPTMVNEFFVVAHRAGQRWCYFPDMLPNETVLIKNFDSQYQVRFGAHGALDDSGVPPDALPRESIEARTFAFLG